MKRIGLLAVMLILVLGCHKVTFPTQDSIEKTPSYSIEFYDALSNSDTIIEISVQDEKGVAVKNLRTTLRRLDDQSEYTKDGDDFGCVKYLITHKNDDYWKGFLKVDVPGYPMRTMTLHIIPGRYKIQLFCRSYYDGAIM